MTLRHAQDLKNWQGTACVVGLDFGDSGKGRLVDDLADRAHIVARFNGGANTGHTIVNQFGKFALHIVPSGIFNPKALCLVGRGVAVNLESVAQELAILDKAGVSTKNLIIDEQASLTMPWHVLRDSLREKFRHSKIGTTLTGVGPTYADRVERVGLRIKDLLSADFADKLHQEIKFQNKFFRLRLKASEIYQKYSKFAKKIRGHIGRTIPIVKEAQRDSKNILFEGAQGTFLDIDFGTYPYVTSSNPGVIGIWRSFDFHPSDINHRIGITKAYLTRVGAGPFPTKLDGRLSKEIINRGREFGTTTGRARSPGWLDLVLVKAAAQTNRVTSLAITKLDVLSGLEKIKICTAYRKAAQKVTYLSGDADALATCQPVYETLPGWSQNISDVREFKKLPKNAQNYLKFIENYLGVPVKFISVGPKRGEVIYV